jgi:ABC-type dipeptide/oligopeptide/nickel transport system permease component
MLFKLVIAALLIAIVVSLFSGLVFMMKDSSSSKRTVRALTVRVALSATLIILLLVGIKLGWIHPHGIGRH